MSAVHVENISHHYPLKGGQTRSALKNVSFDITAAEIFGLLGPNGSGKTTLFKILTTALQPTEGSAEIFGVDIRKNPQEVRRNIGVVFQAPSLDKKLTVYENALHQGHLYGLSGEDLKTRIEALLQKLALIDRKNDLVEQLSGGLARRAEIAKCLLHNPKLLLMDEPSTGLDPGARHDLWDLLFSLKEQGVTIMLATHLMDEGDKCDRLMVMNEGRVVLLGSPDQLKRKIGGDMVVVQTREAMALQGKIVQKFGGSPKTLGNTVRVEIKEGHKFVPALVEAFPGMVDAVSVGKPTLEDVFVHETGHGFNKS